MLVKRKQYSVAPSTLYDQCYPDFVVPRYERTRKVEVRLAEHLPGRVFLHCSCGYYDRQGIVCRHQYAVLRRGSMPARTAPVLGDIAVR
jgi:SWIM zinc finger